MKHLWVFDLLTIYSSLSQEQQEHLLMKNRRLRNNKVRPMCDMLSPTQSRTQILSLPT